MDILFLSTFLGKKLGGAEISSELLFDEMRKKNNIIFLTLKKYKKKSVISCNLWFLPKHVFLIGNQFLDFILYKIILYKIKKYKFNIIHVQDLFILPAAILLSKKIKKPIICTVRDSLPRELGLFSFLFYKRNKVYFKSLNQCSKIIAISNSIKEDLINIKLPDDKIEVIYNISSNLNTKVEIKNKNENLHNVFNILSLGRLHKEKGFDILIDAIDILVNKENLQNIFVTIAGSGVEESSLSRRIAKLNLSKKITIKPWIENKNLGAEYKRSDIVVVPSIFKEPLGRVAIESITYRTPVVASNIGGLKEIVHDGINGFLFKSGDSHELADKIKRLVKDRALLEAMKKNTLKFSEDFNTEFICAKTQKLYEATK